MLTIDIQTARRFVLGKQGLWPGRRWAGPEGAERAMREMEYLQLDPLQVVARSHDIAMHARVAGYRPGQWEELAYGQRKFFDWGGWLAVRPMEELPHWRAVMARERDGVSGDSRIHRMAAEHADAIAEMREVLRERGTVTNRDFEMASRKRTESYRGRKDSALALYYLWRTGEVMTHHRERFERVYALAEAVAPAELLRESGGEETDRFLVRKEVSFYGLGRLSRVAESFHGRGEPDRAGRRLADAMLADGELVEVKVEGWRAPQLALGPDAALLEELAAGRVPAAWAPVGADTRAEATILAPLDHVSARGRAKELFGFEYIWEVYKPAEKRRHGYYTMPLLWGDRLVARFDSKLDRATGTLVILGLWLEEEPLGRDGDFAEALGRALARFGAFLGAPRLDVAAVGEPLLRGRAAELYGA